MPLEYFAGYFFTSITEECEEKHSAVRLLMLLPSTG